MLELIQEHATPTVLDLGANIGTFSGLVLDRYPAARVHAIEAAPATYRLLASNRRRNPSATWHTQWAAIWHQNGEVAFAENGVASTSSFVVDGAYGMGRPVPAITLETLFSDHVRGHVDLLKMDIEGSEEGALRNCAHVLANVGCAVVEIHPERCDPAPVIKALNTHFKYLYEAGDRSSSKPVVVATRTPSRLPAFRGLERL